MNEWLRYLIAFVVACHGLTYLLFGFLAPAGIKHWKGSRILAPVLSTSQVHIVIPVAHAVAGAAIMAAGLAIAIAPLVPGLWVPLAIFGGLVSIVAFVTFWDGRLESAVQEGGIGLGLSVILIVAALAFPGIFN